MATYKERIEEQRIATRRYILSKFDDRCAYCGCELDMDSLNVDHVVSKQAYRRIKEDLPSNFEVDGIDNLFPACQSCNCSKCDGSVEWYRDKIHELRTSLLDLSPKVKIAMRLGYLTFSNKPIIFHFEKYQNG